jgi:hypothetical protein
MCEQGEGGKADGIQQLKTVCNTQILNIVFVNNLPKSVALDLAEGAEEAAVERKEVRRVKPLLSELQVPEWQELELAKDRRKWRNMLKSIKIRR